MSASYLRDGDIRARHLRSLRVLLCWVMHNLMSFMERKEILMMMNDIFVLIIDIFVVYLHLDLYHCSWRIWCFHLW